MRNRTNDSLRVFWEVKPTYSRSCPSSFQQDSYRPSGVEVMATSTCLRPVGPYLPSTAGQALFAMKPDHAVLSPWAGFGVFCAWTALGLAAAVITLRHRDA